jgi:hypothetical protein
MSTVRDAAPTSAAELAVRWQRPSVSATLPAPLRDATLATLLLTAAIYVGSGRLVHFDGALTGYCAATLVACFALSYEVSAFWRRRPSAFYGRALWHGLGKPALLLFAARRTGRDVAAQRFIARRSRVRWAAHMALAWGTLAGFAITLPLVWGWLHFDAAGERSYRAVFLGLPLLTFDTRGPFAWLVFNTLNLAAAAVIFGAGYFLVQRLRQRHEAGTTSSFHLAPLLLLLAVAATGLALPLSAAIHAPLLHRLAVAAHEATVIALLVSLPYAKLIHLFVRPLHIGAQVLRRASAASAHCASCHAPVACAEQLDGVESLLAERGFRFGEHQRLCPPCRRRRTAATHAQMLRGRFHPA